MIALETAPVLFDPLVREWFAERFPAPTEPQRLGWPEIQAGNDVLISAPTGNLRLCFHARFHLVDYSPARRTRLRRISLSWIRDAMSLVFEWDLRKARANLRKHRVSFVEAVSVFSDPLARIFGDEDHSAGEQREIVIGHASESRLLLVCFTEPATDRVRIISARSATKREQQDYEEHITN